jgi:hypothetical protein
MSGFKHCRSLSTKNLSAETSRRFSMIKFDIKDTLTLKELSANIYHDIAVMHTSEMAISVHAFTMVKIW